MRRIAIPLLVLAAAVLGAQQATAAPACTTTATQSGSWTAAATWNQGVPDAADHACVPGDLTVTLSSGTATVLTVQVAGTLQVGGTLNLTSTSDDSTARAIALTAGKIGGAGTLRISESLTWTGGAMGDGGRTVIEPGAVATQQNDVPLWETRTLEIAGTLRMTTANGDITRSGTPLIHVRDGGLLEATSGAVNGIDPVVDNDGRLEAPVAGTTLELNTGGPAGSSGGSFGAPGAAGTVRFDGSTPHALAGGATLRGGVTVNGNIALPAGATVTASGANAMTAGKLQGAGTLEIRDTFTWTGGAMGDDGITRVLAGATLTQQDDHAGLWDTRTLDVAGTLVLATPGRGIQRSGTPAITVAETGLVRATAGGSSFIDPVVHNHGRVEASAGATLELNNGGGTGASDGDFGALAGGTVRFDGSTPHRLADGARLLGGAEIAGNLTVPAGTTVAATGANGMSAGELQGEGMLTIDGAFAWSGGAMGDGGLTRVLPTGTLTTTNTVSLWDTRRLENAGTIALAADRHINRSGNPSIHNLAGATLRKAAGGASTIDPPIENDGTVVAEAAGSTLTIRGGSAGGVSTGSFGGAGTVELDSFNGRFVLGPGAAMPGGVAIASGTVELADGAAVVAAGPLTLDGGSLGGAGNLTVTGSMTWSGGTMAGSGVTTIAEGATLTLPEQGGHQLAGTRTLRVGGLLDASEDNSLYGEDSLLHVLPTGTLRKSGGDNWTFIDLPQRHDGLVESLAGELRLQQGGPEPHTGRFRSAAADAFVSLAGTGHALTGAARLEDFTRIDGEVAVRDGDTLELAADVVQTDGELSGDVEITGTLMWSGGSHEAPGATTVAPGGELVVDRLGASGCATTSLGEARRLVNEGVVRLLRGSHLGAFGEARPEIHNAGRLELDSGSGCGAFTGIAGDALVANTGEIVKVGGAGSSYVGSSLDNDGTILDSAPGELRLESNAAIGHSGTFGSTGGAVVFDSGTFVLDPGATVTGAAGVDGAELRLPEGMTLAVAPGDTLRLAGGSITGAGDLRVSGALAWSGGAQEGPGTTTIEAGGTAAIAPPQDDDSAFVALEQDRALVNRGATTVQDAYVGLDGGASILNRGSLTLSGGTRLSGSGFGYGYGALLHNAGTLRTGDGSEVEADVPLDNDGLLEVGTGTLELAELMNWSGNGFYGESGLAGGEYRIRGTLVVPGPMTANGSRLTLDGAASRIVARSFSGGHTDALAGFHRNAGGGELVLRGGRSLDLAKPFLNHGILDLGPGSTLRAAGFRQTAGAVFRPAVGGQVVSTAAAELGGRLDTPATVSAPGDVSVLSAPSLAGAFASVTGAYQAFQTATGITLRPPGGTAGLDAAGAPDRDTEVRRIDGAALIAGGPWTRRGAYLVARRRGATLTARAVRGRGVSLVARTCRRCGAVRVSWAGRSRVVRLGSKRAERRTLRVFTMAGTPRGTVRVRTTSARRVAIDALLVSP